MYRQLKLYYETCIFYLSSLMMFIVCGTHCRRLRSSDCSDSDKKHSVYDVLAFSLVSTSFL